MKGYNANANAYQFRAQDWTTGDANRISANNITYDLERNVIKAKSTGANNIALMLKYQELDYDIDKAQKFLVVRGSNLSTTDGNSYLWWLNGANQGSQVKPTTVKTITVDGSKQTLVAWNMTTSGLYGNFTGDRPSICMGQTIFGLTSSKSDGSCEIHDINFVASVNDYINTTTMVASALSPMSSTTAYDLTGRRLQGRPQRGSLYIQNQTKRLAH